jgi:uncharacterized membrane protein (UPF0182 family)
MEQSLLYVEPLYLQAESGQIPELKRVVVASGEKVVMADTLADGLVRLFPEGGLRVESGTTGVVTGEGEGGTTGPVITGEPPSDLTQQVYDLARQADEHYTAAQDALQAGDWATYGAELDAMEQVLRQLVEITGPLAE